MQGLVNLTTALADGIAVLLPTACYFMACGCFLFFAWTLWSWSDTHSRYSHPHRHRPWVPWVSLALCGVFATFPGFLNAVDVSFGTDLTVGLTSYTATAASSATGVLGSTPTATIVNVVTLFRYFFEAFGAACVFWSLVRWRGIINGRVQGSPVSCAIQFVFGACCINIVKVTAGLVSFFTITST